MKRSHLVLVGILVAMVVLCVSLWVGEGPLWRWVMTKHEPLDILFSGWTEAFTLVEVSAQSRISPRS